MADHAVELIDRTEAAARLPEFRALLEAALAAQVRARAGYSGFRVGAAVLGGSGAVFPGCNVESASYGATICAERSAVVGAVVGGETSIRACVVVTPTTDPSSPCGICRQLLAEFGGDLLVFAASSVGDSVYVATLADLLPLSFGPGNLAAAGERGAAGGPAGGPAGVPAGEPTSR
jgi:cytidine deaminase